MGRAALSWNAEQTDAKGFWVATEPMAEAVELHTGELDAMFEALTPPQFTISGEENAQPLARWEIDDTQIPDDAFEEPTAPTEEAPLAEVRVLARNPSYEVRSPRPRPAAPAELTAAEKRALAMEMVARAKAAQAGHHADEEPSLTSAPTEEAQSMPSSVRWDWDEADPLAVAERPSLALVQAAPETSDAYGNHLATPMPAPPRPFGQVTWPLPAPRPAPTGELAPLGTLPRELLTRAEAPAAVDGGAWLVTLAWIVAGLVACGAFAAVASLAVFAVALMALL